MKKKTYQFGEFLLDRGENRLIKNGQAIVLKPKVFDMLVVFVERHGELLSRDELMNAVWADTFVEETNLRFCIHAIRKALGKNEEGKDFIETIPKRGYRFTAEVEIITSETEIFDDLTAEKNVENLSETKREIRKPKRRLFLGVFIFAVICCAAVGLAWMKYGSKPRKNLFAGRQIAVLPFETNNQNDKSIRAGITELLTVNLEKIRSLKVVSPKSVQAAAANSADARLIGKNVGAEIVLTGNYRVEGDKIVVTSNLLDVFSGENIWTENFTVTGKDNFEIENAVALRCLRLLSLRIAEEDDKELVAAQNLNADAVKNYLAARKIALTGELFRRTELIGLYKKAVELEPDWALARAGFAEATLADDQMFLEYGNAEKIAVQTIALDNSLAASHTVLGEVNHGRDWNWKEAENQFKKAALLDPNYALNYQKYAEFLILNRRFGEAELELKKAIEIEPFSPIFRTSLCELYSFNDKITDAIAACKYAIRLDPEYWFAPKVLFWIYIKRKMYREIDEMVLSKLSAAERAEHPLTKPLADGDLKPFFRTLISEPSKKSGKIDRPVTDAIYYIQLGDKEKTYQLLESALAERDDTLPTINSEPVFDPIRYEPRFTAIISKLGL